MTYKFKSIATTVALMLAPSIVHGQYILSLPSNGFQLTLQDEIFKDQLLVKRDVQDSQDRGTIEANISEAESDLTRAQKSRKQTVLRSLLTDSAALVDFNAKAIDGRINGDVSVTAKELSASRQKMINYAKQILNSKPSKQDQILAQYAIITQTFIMSGRFNIPAALLTNRDIPERMRSKFAFISAIQKNDFKQARQLSVGFSKLGRIAAIQLIAKKESSPKDINFLTASAKSLPGPVGQKLLGSSIYLLAKTPGFRWSKAPLSFKGTSFDYPVQERRALDFARSGNINEAKAIFTVLAKAFEGKKETASFDRLLVTIARSHANKSKDPKSLEMILVKLRDKYRDESVMGDGQSAALATMRSYIDQEHRSLVDRSINSANSNKANRQLRLVAIGFSNRFSASTTDEQLKQKYQSASASLLAIDGQHAKAVTLYMDLALNGEEKNRITYLKYAINSQERLAQWPETTPWALKNLASSRQTISLQNMYASLLEKPSESKNWDAIANHGLLMILNGQQESAFAGWRDAISNSPAHQNANLAAQYMMKKLDASSSWQTLEDTARLALKHNLSPAMATAALGKSLLFGGKKLLAQQDFSGAAKKLKEFCATYQSHPNRDDGLFNLATAYRGTGEHLSSVEALRELTNDYPKSKFTEAAYAQGGDSALSMAMEDTAIYFYQGYLNRFISGKHAARIGEELTNLYIGRELFAEAITILKANAYSKNLPASVRTQAAERWLEIEERNGNTAAASIAATYLKNLSDNPGSKARAYAAIARQQLAKNDLAGLKKTEASLAAVAADSVEAQEYLGEVRFYTALKATKQNAKEIYNIELKDPLATMNREYSLYLTAKNMFEGVCKSGVTSYCAPAMTQVAMIANDIIPRLDGITIPDTYEQKIVTAFADRKEDVINTLADDSRSYNELAVTKMKDQQTRPDWAQQILWENSTDWNFDRITGEAGNGYVQYEARSVNNEK